MLYLLDSQPPLILCYVLPGHSSACSSLEQGLWFHRCPITLLLLVPFNLAERHFLDTANNDNKTVDDS